MFTDIHTNIEQYKQEEIDNIINRWRLSNIITVVSTGTTVEDSIISIELAKKYPDILSGIGLHPSDLKDTWKSDLVSIEKLVDENSELNQYKLLNNKGYGTKDHINAIKEYGHTSWHRKSFKI